MADAAITKKFKDGWYPILPYSTPGEQSLSSLLTWRPKDARVLLTWWSYFINYVLKYHTVPCRHTSTSLYNHSSRIGYGIKISSETHSVSDTTHSIYMKQLFYMVYNAQTNTRTASPYGCTLAGALDPTVTFFLHIGANPSWSLTLTRSVHSAGVVAHTYASYHERVSIYFCMYTIVSTLSVLSPGPSIV